jgi:N-acetylmuramoyl-L-alanine amidase CwlA
MVAIKTDLANRKNYGSKRKKSDIKWIVVHFTANDGDHDENNAKYFKRDLKAEGKAVASAHYFVDDDSITQSVPDDFVAYHVGGAKYASCAQTGGGKYYGKCTNANSIGIEMCDTVRDGVVQATLKTMANTADLIKSLMDKYDIGIDHVIRHFDVTGKLCPSYLVDEKAWKDFKECLKGNTEEKFRMTNNSYLRTSPAVDHNKVSYSKISDALKKKCIEKNGYAVFKAGATFTRVKSAKDASGNKWYLNKSGYWLPAVYNGKKRVEDI